MRISDKERREIARKLREIERQTLCELTDGELIDFLVEAVGFNRYTNEDFDEGLLGRIADLIDRPSTTRHGKFRTKYGRETPCCDVCGYSIGDMRWGYCPKCGSEVVS